MILLDEIDANVLVRLIWRVVKTYLSPCTSLNIEVVISPILLIDICFDLVVDLELVGSGSLR